MKLVFVFVFQRVGGLLKTGLTQANVMDLWVTLVGN
jgi:hypothetical protein